MSSSRTSSVAGAVLNQAPFQVRLDGQSGAKEHLECNQVLRLLPGRRLVCAGVWNKRDVVAKIYFGAGTPVKHWQQEIRGLKALEERGVAAPGIIHTGTADDSSAHVVILDRILDATDFQDVWYSELGQEALLVRLVAVFASHHRAGLEHRDPHLRNFLVVGNDVYTLDGGGVRVRKKALGKIPALRNLALLIAQFEPVDEQIFAKLFSTYMDQRGWETTALISGLLAWYVDRCRTRRRKKYLKKIFRNCSEVACYESSEKWIAFRREHDCEEFRSFLHNLDASLDHRSTRMLKNGNTSTVWLTEVSGRLLVVKRYNMKNVVHRLGRLARRSRASLSWRNAHRLLFYRIATAMPVALVEERTGPFRGRAYFITELIEGVDCDRPITEDAIKNIGVLHGRLAEQGITHGDTKATNIICKENEPVLVDLDAMKQHRCRCTFQRSHARDIRRLLQNWDDQPDVQSRLRSALYNNGLINH